MPSDVFSWVVMDESSLMATFPARNKHSSTIGAEQRKFCAYTIVLQSYPFNGVWKFGSERNASKRAVELTVPEVARVSFHWKVVVYYQFWSTAKIFTFAIATLCFFLNAEQIHCVIQELYFLYFLGLGVGSANTIFFEQQNYLTICVQKLLRNCFFNCNLH